jgi:N-acyl-D-aspartate/D-glutamate deacylase
MLDCKIINGYVIDGSGAPGFHADIAIRGGRIVAIGKVDEAAQEVIDADGQVVAPGFIDSHTHYDAQVFWDPHLSPSCYHGVTTILGGNCGFSIAPLAANSAEYLGPMLARVEGMPLATLQSGVPWDWTSFGSYLDRLEGKLGLNAGFFVGHSTIRRAVMGERAVGFRATEADLAAMEGLLNASLREGALGFSTTVSRSHNDADGNPVPSRHASREEILRLAAVCRKHEGTTLELLPNLDFDPETIELLIDFSLAGQRPVNWNVLTINDSTAAEVAEAERKLAVSDSARRKGAEVIALAFVSPPTARISFWAGTIFDAFPDWAPLFRLSKPERLEKLRDLDYRRFLDQRANSADAGVFRRMAAWETYTICQVFSAENKRYEGRKVGEIATQLGKTPFDTMLDIVVADGLRTTLMPPGGQEDKASYEARAKIWKDNRTVVGASDAGAHMDMIDAFAFSTRLLQKGVREHQVISLEEAVHQLTAVPARMMGLRTRGLIRQGRHADLVIFDPHSVAQGSVYTRFDLPGEEGRLYAEAEGISRVLVNGATIVNDGKHTGATPGTVLRSGRDTANIILPAASG